MPLVEGIRQDPITGLAQLAIADNGTLAYQTEGDQAERRTLVWVDREGNEQPIAMEPRGYVTPRLSPDGQRIVVDTEDVDADLFIYNLENQVEEQFTFNRSSDRFPLWSRDGSEVFFSSTRDGKQLQLLRKPADGGGSAEPVLVQSVIGTAGGWSGDGDTLVFSGGVIGGVDIFTVRLDGSSEHKPLLQTPANEAVPAMSADGRWLAYRSNETGEQRVYVRPFPDVNSGVQQASDGRGNDPLWSPDGRELFYHGPDGVMVVPVEHTETFRRGAVQLLFSLAPTTRAPIRTGTYRPTGSTS